MLRRLRIGAPSPALVVAVLAFSVALSGTAMALQANSVGSKELRRKAVGSRHLKRSAIGSKQVRDGSLRGVDLRNDSVTGADVDEATLTLPPRLAPPSPAGQRGQPGPRGPQGPPGPQGPRGETGDRGPSDALAAALDGELDVLEAPASSTVASVSARAGSYVLDAKLLVEAPGDSVVTCRLVAIDAGGEEELDLSQVDLPPDDVLDTISLQAADGAEGGGRIYEVRCSKGEADVVTASFRRLSAIRVGTLGVGP